MHLARNITSSLAHVAVSQGLHKLPDEHPVHSLLFEAPPHEEFECPEVPGIQAVRLHVRRANELGVCFGMLTERTLVILHGSHLGGTRIVTCL